MNPHSFDGTVLVVDDESFVLRTTKAVLERLGFAHVAVADNVESAVNLITSVTPPVGLVFVDLNIPGTDGLKLLQRFEEMGYHGEVLIFSGEDSQTLHMAQRLANERKLSVVGAIAKPIQIDQLQGMLSQCIGQEPITLKPSKVGIITPDMLDKAIDQGELVPWFQPKIDVKRLIPVGVEALARWPKSGYGPIFPDQFIPMAEQHGLIDKLTFSIIEQAAAAEGLWRKQGIELKVAVNLAMASLYDAEFPSHFEQRILQGGSEMSRMQIEVTESQLMEDLIQPLEALLRLRMKKTKLSIDDFGTGHSNLNQLRDLPFDELKLDRSYVRLDTSDERTNVILEASVDIAKKLNMSIVAEGVETLEEWRRIEQLGCDQVQGYFIAKPMPVEEIPTWVRAWSDRRRCLLGSKFDS